MAEDNDARVIDWHEMLLRLVTAAQMDDVVDTTWTFGAESGEPAGLLADGPDIEDQDSGGQDSGETPVLRA
jgi:hypothetical protein